MAPTSIPSHIVKRARELGYEFDAVQLNIGGERELLSPNKFVLTGKEIVTGKPIVFKWSHDNEASKEIIREHEGRKVIAQISFANETLLMPKEFLFELKEGEAILVTEFIEQEKILFEYPIREQFFLLLKSLEAQESFHATTYEHRLLLNKTFPILDGSEYSTSAARFVKEIQSLLPNPTHTALLSEAAQLLDREVRSIERYCGYLIHTDFVPHNFRIHQNALYLLDFASFAIANKYEPWARLSNFMLIHSPELEKKLTSYIEDNQSAEEAKVYNLLRIYRILFLLRFYSRSLSKTVGDLHTLTEARLIFWFEALASRLTGLSLSKDVRTEYIEKRNRLRTESEKQRQRQFTQA